MLQSNVTDIAHSVNESGRLFRIFVLVLCGIYVAMMAHTPIALLAIAGLDDGLYIRLGRSIAEGKWLGPYNELTLVKPPGYPLFLAFAHWFGLSATASQALFHCVAVVFFTSVCRRFVRSAFAAAALFIMLLWTPVTYSAHALRIVRDGVYADQILVVLAAFALSFFGTTRKERMIFACAGGAALGWLWLTREESIWAAALLAMPIAALVAPVTQRRWSAVIAPVIVILITFVTVHAGYRFINLVYYGSFVGAESQSSSFKRALSALHSVQSGEVRPFVSVTSSTRSHVYEVSPAFATLRPFFEGDGGRAWAHSSCVMMPWSCGEIGSGWFAFALRDAASRAGHFSSPGNASKFFSDIADEISAACSTKLLTCKSKLVAEVPNFTWEQVAQIPHDLWQGLNIILSQQAYLGVLDGSGQHALWYESLSFLNYPTHTKSLHIPRRVLMRGWYHHNGRDWFSVTVQEAKPSEYAAIERLGSEDIAEYFRDPDAIHNRFTIHVACFEDCLLHFSGSDGTMTKRLSELQAPLGFDVGGGQLFIDAANVTDDSTATTKPTATTKAAAILRSQGQKIYAFLAPVILFFGIASFIIIISFFLRRALANVCFIIALTAWMLTLCRLLLIATHNSLIGSSLSPQYLQSANMLVMSAAILSCVAAYQCWTKPDTAMQLR